MPDREGSGPVSGALPVEVIDELGHVVETIYVGEITSNSCPVAPSRRRSDRHRVPPLE